MARYGQDYGRNYDRWNSMGGMDRGYGGRGMDTGYDRGYGGGMGQMGGGMGGMERGYGGEYNMGRGMGQMGGMGGGMGRGYDTDYGGMGQTGGGMGMGGMERGYGGDYNPGGGMGRGMGGGYQGYGYGGGTDMGWGGGGSRGYGMNDFVGERGGGWQQDRESTRMRAADLMTENPECVTPDATLAEVAQRMRDMDVGIIPVVDSTESRRLRGVITDRDIAIRAVAEGKDGKAKVSECMTSGVQTVNKNDSVQEVLGLMEREQVRRVPVTDREGRLVGIIAQADLATEYADRGRQSESRFADTMERISEPARPERTRGGAGGGGSMQAGARTGGTSGRATGSATSGRGGGAATGPQAGRTTGQDTGSGTRGAGNTGNTGAGDTQTH